MLLFLILTFLTQECMPENKHSSLDRPSRVSSDFRLQPDLDVSLVQVGDVTGWGHRQSVWCSEEGCRFPVPGWTRFLSAGVHGQSVVLVHL